jgi:hypothetical protein
MVICPICFLSSAELAMIRVSEAFRRSARYSMEKRLTSMHVDDVDMIDDAVGDGRWKRNL